MLYFSEAEAEDGPGTKFSCWVGSRKGFGYGPKRSFGYLMLGFSEAEAQHQALTWKAKYRE
jgi:hypothetical protein